MLRKNVVKLGTNLDTNATLGLKGEVWEELRPILEEQILNPSSLHSAGQRARYLVEEARSQVSDLLNLKNSARVVFTSGATESNNTAVLLADPKRGDGIVTSSIEHPSLLEAAKNMQANGCSLSLVSPNKKGVVSVSNFIEALTPKTRLVSLMFANNETGALQPVVELGEELRRIGTSAFYHIDAVQALGKAGFDFNQSCADLISISGHKIGSLPGVGALIVKEGIELVPILHGGPQEKRLRAGTENVPGIVSFGIAAKLLHEQQAALIKMQKHNREVLWSSIRDSISNISPTVDLDQTIPNTLSLLIDGVSTSDLIVALDLEGVFISAGSACASGKPGASHVLLAMGMTEDEAKSVIRISLSGTESEEELKAATQKISSAIKRMRNE